MSTFCARTLRVSLPVRGVGLIEVLVTIVILAIGILGLAGLQASGLRVGQGAMYRGIAAQFAYDMADRMRANGSAAKGGAYNRALGATLPDPEESAAAADQNDWMTRLTAALPGADGAVALAADGDTATITVQWDDRRAAARESDPDAAQTAQFMLVTQLWND